MAAHRTRVMYLGNNTYAAICSCGWAKPETKDKTVAQADANRHAYKNMTVEDNSQLELSPSSEGAATAPRSAKKA